MPKKGICDCFWSAHHIIQPTRGPPQRGCFFRAAFTKGNGLSDHVRAGVQFKRIAVFCRHTTIYVSSFNAERTTRRDHRRSQISGGGYHSLAKMSSSCSVSYLALASSAHRRIMFMTTVKLLASTTSFSLTL